MIESGTAVYRNERGELEPAESTDRVFGVALSNSVPCGDSHYVEVESRPPSYARRYYAVIGVGYP